ncbi:M1 family aminopeptidase [Rubrivirga sp. IMCC45206]|uniref:M1 family aminopeptidase n=1 Tax=Rubrivirga sp. IMCC45206 TaxID=3391614 RepID=UPI00398FFF2B
MPRLSALTLFLLLAACGGDAPSDGVEAPGPQADVDVREVRAEITLDPATLALDGTVALTVAHPPSLVSLVLGLDDVLEVATVRVDGEGVLFVHDGDALHVPLFDPAVTVGDSTSVVEVVYSGTPNAGLYADDVSGARVVFTDGWPDRTAGWLPGVHHPSDPARLDLTLDVPSEYEVVASGALVSDDVADGRRRARFVLDGDAPVYTFAFAVGDFSITEQAGVVPIRHALLAGDAAYASRLARTPEILATLEGMLGDYPYASYATVQVPMVYAGMENATAAFLRADLYGETLPGRVVVEEVNVHEIVHQWWGNAVVPADWRDLWIAEGAATFLTTALYDTLDGRDAGRAYLTLMSRAIGGDDADARLVPEAYADPADVLSPTVYQKGGSVFYLLSLALGEDVFYPALRAAAADFADRPLSTEAFQASLEQTSGRDLGPIFDYWVWGEGRPTLRTRWDRDTRTLAWEIEGDDDSLANLPFELRIAQGDDVWFVPVTDGVFTPSGDRRPDVEPVGVLLKVRR